MSNMADAGGQTVTSRKGLLVFWRSIVLVITPLVASLVFLAQRQDGIEKVSAKTEINIALRIEFIAGRRMRLRAGRYGRLLGDRGSSAGSHLPHAHSAFPLIW